MTDYSALSYESGTTGYKEGTFSPFEYTGISSISYVKGTSTYTQAQFSPFKYTGIASKFYTPSTSVTKYFKMAAYDTSASIWRTWIATGAADITASQYPGSPFPFTTVFVLSIT